MPTFTDRATRTLKLQKAERPKIGNGLPPIMDGFEGENRIQMVNGNPRLYYRANNAWYFTGLSQDGTTPDIPTATSTRLGLIKIGSGGTVSSDGTYTATAATPAADDITGGDAAVTISTSSGNITIDAAANNSDIIFKGTDATSDITMLTLDGSEAGAATFNNKVVATELDISGNADIDGTLEADVITVNGTALATFIRDTVGTNMLSSNTETGIAVTYDTSNDNIDFVINAAQTTITSIYATDLILGEDSQTAIDFGTANEIDFKADNAARLTLSASVLYPVTNNQIDLGTSSLEFKDAFFDGTVTSDAFAGPLTGNVTGDVSGNAGTVTVATNADSADRYILFTASTSGSLAVLDNGALKFNPGTGVLTVPNMTISTALTVNELTASDNLDIGTYGFRAAELYADNRTSGRVAFYAANGQLQDDSDLTFSTATLTATAFSGPLSGNVSGNLTGTVLTATQGTIDHDSLANFVTNEHINWVNASAGTIHASNYTNTVDMGDGFKLVDADSNVDVTEGEYVKFTTQSGSGGVGVVTGAGTSGDPHLVTLNYNDTNTVDMGDGFVIEDGDGTEVTVTENKEVKFIDTTGIDINWTDTSTGSDGDPFDLTFTLSGPLQDIAGLSVTNSNFIVGDGSNFVLENASTARTSLGLGTIATSNQGDFKEHDDVETVALGGTGATSLTSNAVLTGNGTSAITAEGNLTFDGSTLTCTGALSTTGIIKTSSGSVSGSAGAPTLAFGDGDSGFFESGDDNINITIGGTVEWQISGTKIGGTETGSAFIVSAAGSAAAAVYSFNDDPDTGMYRTQADHIGFTTSGTKRVEIASDGGFYAYANIYATSDVVAYSSSDPVLKENKELIDNPLEKICKLGGYSFDWKESAKEHGNHLEGHDYGVMADEIADVLPELVQTRDNGIRAVKYDKLVPLLIEGIKELKQELNMIKGES